MVKSPTPVLVIGSLNMDMVAITERLPQKGETIMGSQFMTFPGGKGANQAVAAARLGAKVWMAGCVGKDGFGNELLSSLRKSGVNTEYVDHKDGSTGVALITVDSSGMNTIIVVSGANAKCDRGHVDAALEAIGEPGILLLQNELTADTVEYAIRAAHARKWKIILNPAPARQIPRAILSLVDIVIPNESEAGLITGLTIANSDDAVAAARRLVGEGVGWAIVTLGSKGAVCCSNKETHRLEAIKVDAVDTTAAGDAYTGALAFALAEGWPMLNSLHFAGAAAALSVTRLGAQPSLGSREEVEHFISHTCASTSGRLQ
jgi:ribokinase